MMVYVNNFWSPEQPVRVKRAQDWRCAMSLSLGMYLATLEASG